VLHHVAATVVNVDIVKVDLAGGIVTVARDLKVEEGSGEGSLETS
jgi:hypothetical protein